MSGRREEIALKITKSLINKIIDKKLKLIKIEGRREELKQRDGLLCAFDVKGIGSPDGYFFNDYL